MCVCPLFKKKEQALNIKNTLTEGKGGKIHVLYSKKDEALFGAFFTNFFKTRLGREGVDLNKVIPEVKDFIVLSKDVTNEDGGHGGHNYQFKRHAIDYYKSMII